MIGKGREIVNILEKGENVGMVNWVLLSLREPKREKKYTRICKKKKKKKEKEKKNQKKRELKFKKIKRSQR